MVNFKKYLQESKDRKFDAISRKKDSEHNPYSCNYSPVSHHKYCEHSHCILSDEFRDYDKERTLLENKLREEVAKNELRNKINEEEEYLKHGEGTYGYDKVQVYKNVLKLRKLLGERQYDK